MSRTILALLSLLTIATATQAADIPKFETGLGKSYYLVVGPAADATGRVRIWIAEWGFNRPGTFPAQMRAAGFPVGRADSVEFFFPPAACKFAGKALVDCDGNRLPPEQQRAITVALYESGTSGGPVLQFKGSDFVAGVLEVKVNTRIDSVTKLDAEGKVFTTQTLGLDSVVWIDNADKLNGTFFHRVSGMRLIP